MNLVFEGLKFRKEAIARNAQKAQGLDTSLIEKTYPEALAKDDDVKVDCQPATQPSDQQREKYRYLFGKPVKSPKIPAEKNKSIFKNKKQNLYTSLLEATYPEALAKDDDVKVDCQPTTQPSDQQHEKYRHLFGKTVKSSKIPAEKTEPTTENLPPVNKNELKEQNAFTDPTDTKEPAKTVDFQEKPSFKIPEQNKDFDIIAKTSTSVVVFNKNAPDISFIDNGESAYSMRLKELKRNIKQSIDSQQTQSASPKFSLLSFLGSTVSVCESVILAPIKLLRFSCGAPLSTLKFHLNITKKILKLIRSFFQFFNNRAIIIRNKIKQILLEIFNIYRNAWKKLMSIYLPNHWIQTATAAFIRGLAIAMSCFVVFFAADALFFSHDQSNNGKIILGQATPRRKLKHFFRDPLIVQQKKITETLLSMHVDTVERDEKGNGRIVIDDQAYGIGTQIMEHPRVWLEKVSRKSLYFSDKYGQIYKRAIQDMLE